MNGERDRNNQEKGENSPLCALVSFVAALQESIVLVRGAKETGRPPAAAPGSLHQRHTGHTTLLADEVFFCAVAERLVHHGRRAASTVHGAAPDWASG